MKPYPNKKKLFLALLLFTLAFLIITPPMQIWADPLDGADEIVLSPEEITEFNITLYDEKTQLPLDALVTLDGSPYYSETLRGKYVLVNLWATWCPFCRAEKASVDRLYKMLKSETLTILTVSLGEEPETVRQYMDENQYGFPVAVDIENRLREAYSPRVPTSYGLDPEGNIVFRVNGGKEWDSEQALRVLRYLAAGGKQGVAP